MIVLWRWPAAYARASTATAYQGTEVTRASAMTATAATPTSLKADAQVRNNLSLIMSLIRTYPKVRLVSLTSFSTICLIK